MWLASSFVVSFSLPSFAFTPGTLMLFWVAPSQKLKLISLLPPFTQSEI